MTISNKSKTTFPNPVETTQRPDFQFNQERLKKFIQVERRRHKRYDYNSLVKIQGGNESSDPGVFSYGIVLNISKLGIGFVSPYEILTQEAKLILLGDSLEPEHEHVVIDVANSCEDRGVYRYGANLNKEWLSKESRNREINWNPFAKIVESIQQSRIKGSS